MEEILNNVALGFSVALKPINLLYCFFGATIGQFIGVLPGLGPLVTISMLLPITFYLPTDAGIIMLLGIYYGASYGGSITSIMLKIPGDTSSIMALLDGYPMSQQGRAGPALVITTLASFFAGCIATVIVILFSPVLAGWATAFGPAEFFSMMTFGLVIAASLTQGSTLKGVGMVLIGIVIGLVGTDVTSGRFRFTFGILSLADGISFVAIAMGVFGFAEIISNLGAKSELKTAASRVPWRQLIPRADDMRASWKAMSRGTAVGAVLGVLPGAGPTISSFVAYSLEKNIAKDPSRFGKGAVEGVAAPESANNAACQTSFIPTLTLGIPGSVVMALILAALLIHGIQPGPQLITKHPDLFWGVVVSMWVANLILLILNLPLIGIWIRLLTTPYRYLFPAIIIFCSIGVYTLANDPFHVVLATGFGLLGYVFIKLGCESPPMLLGFILGPMMEENLRRALILSRGDALIFFQEPISLFFMGSAMLFLTWFLVPRYWRALAFRFIQLRMTGARND